MSSQAPTGSLRWNAAISRGLLFLIFWLALSRGNPDDLAAGLATTIVATWASLHLLPPRSSRFSLIALMTFAWRFLYQSIAAGIDVAWRALDPRLPLRTGFLTYQPRLSLGPERYAFRTVASLLPGTLPVGTDQDGALIIHCLDVSQPVLEQLAEDEAIFRRALGEEPDHG
jgi:multicomponent Na+:H+ antiporter subunit E